MHFRGPNRKNPIFRLIPLFSIRGNDGPEQPIFFKIEDFSSPKVVSKKSVFFRAPNTLGSHPPYRKIGGVTVPSV